MAFILTAQWPGELGALQNKQHNNTRKQTCILCCYCNNNNGKQGQEGTTATAPTSERGIVGHYKRGRSEACWTAAEMLPCSFSRYLSLAEYPLFLTSITMATVKALKRSGQPYLTHSSPPLKMHFLTLV